MYPMPKTEAEMNLLDSQSARRVSPRFIEESAFLSDYCWNVSFHILPFSFRFWGLSYRTIA